MWVAIDVTARQKNPFVLETVSYYTHGTLLCLTDLRHLGVLLLFKTRNVFNEVHLVCFIAPEKMDLGSCGLKGV